jgi:hypothetical protein
VDSSLRPELEKTGGSSDPECATGIVQHGIHTESITAVDRFWYVHVFEHPACAVAGKTKAKKTIAGGGPDGACAVLIQLGD